MKKILTSVILFGVLFVNVSANEFEESMKYIDKALTKLILENKLMKNEIMELKQKNLALEIKFNDLNSSLHSGFVNKVQNKDIEEFIKE